MGRPKGSKSRPKWLLAELKKAPKRPRGRPKGSQTKPKTIEELIARADTYKSVRRETKSNRKPITGDDPKYFSKLKREDPERLKALSLKNCVNNAPRVRGKPYGMTNREWACILDDAHKLARKIMAKMDQDGDLPKNKLAREAMHKAVEMLASELPVKDKLSVIRTILEYNMAKPAATNNVNIKTAEDFLDELASKE